MALMGDNTKTSGTVLDVIVGPPSQLLQFAQRIFSDLHLAPLPADDVAEYIDYRLRAMRAKTSLFSNQACQLVAAASRGVSRTVNILCDTGAGVRFCRRRRKITLDM
jgi:hypothetical protein